MKREPDGERRVDAGVEARASELTQGMLRLVSKVELAEQFLAAAAHEMKTPLANVRGELQLALMRERSPEEYRSAIGAALSHTERLIELTNDLLTFAKVSYAPAPRVLEPCNLRSVVSSAAQIAAQDEAASSRLAIAVSTEIMIEGRPEELTRLFRNLLDNALAYSPADSAITVVADRSAGSVLVAIENDGPALEPAIGELLFQPFQRGSSQGGGGFGLGLAIARAVARGHDGDLTLDVRALRPRFVVRLPESKP